MWMIIAEVVGGKCTSYDMKDTEVEADARITELNGLGFSKAYKVDLDVISVNLTEAVPRQTSIHPLGPHQETEHWTCDDVAKTVTLDEATVRTNIFNDHVNQYVRKPRDEKLKNSDSFVLPDRRGGQDTPTQNAWDAYRQALRDLPNNMIEGTDDPTNPTWPTEPS